MNFLSRLKLSSSFGATLVILSSFFYASYGIWTTLMGNFFDGYTASALRSILVVLILAFFAAINKAFEPIAWRKNYQYILGMIVASLFTWGPLYFAFLEAGVGITYAVFYASIVLGMLLFGWLWAAEKITRQKILSAALGIVGLVFIFSPSVAAVGWLALIATVVSGVSAAANTVFAKKIHYNPTQSTLVLWAASIVANILMMFVLGKSAPAFEWQVEWVYLVVFAVASVIASWSLVKATKLIDVGTAGILGLLEIVFGIMFGVVLFHERPSLVALTGVVIVIVAAAVPYLKQIK